MKVNAVKNFRANLRTLLEIRHITQRSLAEKAGITHPYVNRILTNKVEPSLGMCDKIADALDVSFSDLIQNPKIFSLDHLTSVNR